MKFIWKYHPEKYNRLEKPPTKVNAYLLVEKICVRSACPEGFWHNLGDAYALAEQMRIGLISFHSSSTMETVCYDYCVEVFV